MRSVIERSVERALEQILDADHYELDAGLRAPARYRRRFAREKSPHPVAQAPGLRNECRERLDRRSREPRLLCQFAYRAGLRRLIAVTHAAGKFQGEASHRGAELPD